MKKLFVWLLVVAAIFVIGCGGGGGGGGTTDGSTDGGSTGVNTGITGRVRTLGGHGVAQAVVKFYNNGGGLVGQATTNNSGNFGAELPTTVRRFTVDISNARFVSGDTTYTGASLFNQFTYEPEEYLANDSNCLATSPTFTTGQAVPLTSEVVVTERWLGPPSPPTGCLND